LTKQTRLYSSLFLDHLVETIIVITTVIELGSELLIISNNNKIKIK